MSSLFGNISSDVKSITNLPKTISQGIKKEETKVEDEFESLKEKLEYKIEYGIVSTEGFFNKYLIPIGIAAELFYILMILLVLAAVKIFTLLFPSPIELESKAILAASKSAMGSAKLDSGSISAILSSLNK